MGKDAAITVRVPEQLKRRLARRAATQHRSISAQVLYELERALAEESAGEANVPALGLFAGAGLPSDDDFTEVRAALWSRVGS